MASKQVIDRQKQAKLVLATGETHASALTTRLVSELSPHLQRGEKLPDVALLAQLFLRWLGQAETDLVAADLTYERELADDDAPRRARDEAATEVRDQLIELRDLTDALYGAAAVRQLGMTGETPTDPMALLRQAKAVLSALGTTKLPPPRRKGAELAPKELEAELRVPAAALDKALTSVSREAREAEVAGITNLEREFMHFKADLPLHYVRREDYVRGQSIVEAKLDGLAAMVSNAQLRASMKDRGSP